MAKKNYFKQPRKKMSAYKSKSAYLHAIYRANKEAIDKLYAERVLNTKTKSGAKSAYKMLKNQILAEDETWKSLSKADIRAKVNRLSRTKNYFLDKYRMENMKENMFKGDIVARNYVRKKIGWNKRLDWTQVKYHGDRVHPDNRYYYIEDDDGNILVAWKKAYRSSGGDSPHAKILMVAVDEDSGDIAATYRPEEFGDFGVAD